MILKLPHSYFKSPRVCGYCWDTFFTRNDPKSSNFQAKYLILFLVTCLFKILRILLLYQSDIV